MNKGLFSVLLVSLALILPAFAVLDQFGDLVDSGSQYVHVSTLKYEPYPAAPGRYVDVWIKIMNSGTESADVKFKLVPKYPFSIDASEIANRTVNDLAAGQTALLHYKIRVANDAVEGKNPLYYEATMNGMTFSSNLDVWVQTIDSNVAVSSVSTQQIVPGEASPVEIQIENMGDSPLTDINVKLDLTSTTLPFIPVNSTTEKKVYLLEPGRMQTVNFALMALPGATANAYKIPIEIKYVDNTGANYTKSSLIGLVIGSQPDLLVTVSSSEIYAKGNIGNIVLKVTNKGLTNIKFLTTKLKESKNYDILSEDSVYLGNIDSDDYQSSDYRIKANKETDGKVMLELELTYLDANNNAYTEIKEVPLKVISQKDLGTGGDGTLGKVLVLLLLMAAGFFMYRRWEKTKLLKK